ncbi:MAG: FixH family protein [Reichenbachiella sp.]|uniref:FixH family protein n=1 Tax=Reichenbachiella sp. TaxID=2184521 RepID=UPI0032971464
MNWGKSIVLTFVLFAALIITLVVISMKHDVNLVATNYYEEELAYEDQMNRIRNFDALETKPTITRSGDQIILKFPESVADLIESGEIHFFRPSDYSADKKIKIQLDNQYQQSFPASAFKSGLWKTKLRWHSTSKEYFFEQNVIL